MQFFCSLNVFNHQNESTLEKWRKNETKIRRFIIRILILETIKINYFKITFGQFFRETGYFIIFPVLVVMLQYLT